MLSDDDYKRFGLILGTSEPDRIGEKGTKGKNGDNFFEGTFSPPFPMVEEKFAGSQFIYRATDNKEAISILGRTPPGEQFFVQLGFVLPRDSKTNTYVLGRETNGPKGIFVAAGILTADTGTLEIKRNNNRQTIGGDFNMNFKYEGVNYRVYGRFFLNATEPLKVFRPVGLKKPRPD